MMNIFIIFIIASIFMRISPACNDECGRMNIDAACIDCVGTLLADAIDCVGTLLADAIHRLCRHAPMLLIVQARCSPMLGRTWARRPAPSLIDCAWARRCERGRREPAGLRDLIRASPHRKEVTCATLLVRDPD